MWQNWRNYADYYVIPHIGQRKAQEIDGAVLDALYARLLAEGRRKTDKNSLMYEYWLTNPDAKAADLVKSCGVTIYAARAALPRFRHGRKPQGQRQGLAPKTVVNVHRILHRAWEDFEAWKWVHRNVAKDAHPPAVPWQGRTAWTVAQLRVFSTTPGRTGSIPSGYWRRPRVCGDASWPGHAATDST
jgi:hypothetical protein